MNKTGKFRMLPALPLVAAALVLASRLYYRLARRLRRAGKRAEAEQRCGRSIIHNASDAIISTDEAQTILQASPSAAAMFGTTVQAMEGASLDQFIPREQRISAEQGAATYFGATGIHLSMKGRRAADYTVTGLKASGELFPLEGSISSQDEAGRQIYTVILRDVTERKQVQRQLEHSHTQLRELSAALQTIREEERTHIARELHDDLGQLLATLRVDLNLLQQQPPDSAGARKLQHSMDSLLVTAITSLRRIASNLRPRALDEGGLYFALQTLRQEFVDRHGIDCQLHADEQELTLDDAYSTAIFRIIQEALTNIARHAEARRVQLDLHRIDSSLLITIEDDGRGIAEGDMDKTTSFGLIGMRERVWAIHGDISIGSGGGRGTRITIRMPLPPQATPA
ncbi:ATP-binding protein [Rugamonas sp. CCM 8940]|uniref:sensor histidine kinase n=1 Tax=Rugamonas sp. CCM 8940 TaxID=2765359 RepID=UPI0018F7C1D6|nr:ATP-binding protein [Rugamonas sp. CCM 8940]MBJ7314286.1 PAS domain S-box protein [Rugamonas sp. CCM 8940]